MAVTGGREQELLAAAFQILAKLLADDEDIDVKPSPTASLPDSGSDAAWEISAPNYYSTLLVQAFRRFTPRDVERVLGGASQLVRAMVRNPIVVVAPWLSPRSRELLTERGFNYMDLTGNVRLSISRPTVILRLDGAQSDPNPPATSRVRLQGSAINALVRVLVDVEPPYRMVDLARASGLSNGYVSRALDALYEQRLIERSPTNKTVTGVDWPALLRARADNYDLIRSNRGAGYLARTGADALYRRLGDNSDHAVVTGSYAAAEFVRLAAPAQLALYVADVDDFARQHELLLADRGADTLLLRAADRSQLQRPRQVDGNVHVGVSQLALDCLAGNGRLPQEGEALIEWMEADTKVWRRRQLPNQRDSFA